MTRSDVDGVALSILRHVLTIRVLLSVATLVCSLVHLVPGDAPPRMTRASVIEELRERHVLARAPDVSHTAVVPRRGSQ